MKVLHAPLDLAGDGWSLVRGLRHIGVEANLATIASSQFTHVGDIDLSFKEKGRISRQFAKWQFCQKQLPVYDVVHYHAAHSILDYGNGLFSLLDLKAAHRRGQVIAMTFHGCEVRGLHPERCQEFCTNRICEDLVCKKRIERLRPHVDLFYVTTPDLLGAAPYATLLPQSVWGIEGVDTVAPKTNLPLKVVHAPSSRSTKGSDEIIRVCTELIDEGYEIEFKLVENVPHERVLAEFRDADIVIDQTILGWYGVVTVEASALGKPVIVGIEDEYVRRSKLVRPPFLSAKTTTLKQVLTKSYEERASLPMLGERGRKFVLDRHSAVKNAEQVLLDYRRIQKKKKGA